MNNAAYHVLTSTIRSLGNHDGDNGDNDKRIGFMCKTTALHVHHAFKYIFSRPLHDHEVKTLNVMFMEDVNVRQRIFLFFFKPDKVLKNSTPEKIAYI